MQTRVGFVRKFGDKAKFENVSTPYCKVTFVIEQSFDNGKNWKSTHDPRFMPSVAPAATNGKASEVPTPQSELALVSVQ